MKTHRNLWPLGIFVTFGLFFTGMAVVVVIAATHREYLVSENYYEQELKFQNQIEGARRAVKSGASVGCDSAGHFVVIALPVVQQAPELSGKIQFYRPSAPELDHEVPLTLKADGTQTLDVSAFAKGLWQVRVKWTAGGEDYFLDQKITVAGK